jgi:hypothetical protein
VSLVRLVRCATRAAEWPAHPLIVMAITMCNAFHERNQFYFFSNISNTLDVYASSAMTFIILLRVEPGVPVKRIVRMPHPTEALTMTPTDTQPELMVMHPMMHLSLTPRWRSTAFLHCLHTLVASCTRRRSLESRYLRPDLSQWETVPDLLARQHTHLYIHSLLG